MKFGARQQTGSLEESLKSSVYFDEDDFIVKQRNYNYYGYDERCKQILFTIKDWGYSSKEPFWLFIELDKEV